MSPRPSSTAPASDSDRAAGFAEGVLRVRHAAGRGESSRELPRETELRVTGDSTSVVAGSMRARSVHPADLIVLERAARSIRLRTR